MIEEEENEVIVNDQSENGQKQAQQFNNSNNGNCFMANLALWLALIALGIGFIATFIALCGGYGVAAWFSWIARGVAIASIVIEILKYLKTKQFNIKGELFFVIIISAIVCLAF